MAGASAARAMGFTPYWLDLLAIPGVTTDVINYCNQNYSFFSRLSQRSGFFNKFVWESVTTGEQTLPGLWTLLNNWIIAWPWRFLKTNVKDYAMSELFKNLFSALPSDIPTLTSHMWNCMGAVAGGMTNVVDMMFDNWPMSFQLTEGAKHAVQGPAGYYGFRVMRGFDERGKILEPVPTDALFYTGHHVDHELVENIEVDCADRLRRMKNNEPRRLLVTMGGAGAQRELFKAIIEHCVPLVQQDKVALFVNLGDHKSNWEWLQKELEQHKDLLTTHFVWEDTKALADQIRTGSAHGIHVFLHGNTYHAVYATNYLMRVVDVMITKPSELAFYPVPIIFNERVGGHEMWGAIRGAEIGNGTVEARSIPQTLQAIDMLTQHTDLLTMYCDCIVKNKSIGIYDGAYKSVELATGKKFQRRLKA
jgi:UDP-N-acetylglucosamine:LPS N-acetylglucosamine transferase